MINLFKPHIVELDTGKFVVRKFSILLLGFRFYDVTEPTSYTWSMKHIRWATVNSLEKAQELLDKIQPPKYPKIVKIYENTTN